MSDAGAREEACAPVAVPATLAFLLDGYRWARDMVGESGGAVYRLHGKPHAPGLFLKHGRGRVADDITDEMGRLGWLARYLPGPALAGFVRLPDEAWLVTTAVPGETAYQIMAARPAARGAVVDALAGFMRRLHALPAATCPFNSAHPLRLAQAQTRLNAGLVATEEFDPARAGWSAERVWDAMQALLTFAPDPVVTHGDFSLDNLLLVDNTVTGCIDTGRLGVADRYQDLAILWSCLGEFNPALQARFFAAYGLTEPAWDKLEFHLLLDEMF